MSALFVTRTIPHSAEDKLGVTLGLLAEGRRYVANQQVVKSVRQVAGYIGGIASKEISYGASGWHPHTHDIEYYERELSFLRQMGAEFVQKYPKIASRLSLDEDVLLGLHLAEGLETALAVMAAGFRPCWSTGSSGLMGNFPVLSGIEALTIFADNDASGTGERAAREVAARWRQAGCETHSFVRDRFGDFNDAQRAALKGNQQ